MTASRHRQTSLIVARPDGPELKGRGPGGMWWVAWRQHRMQIAVALALMVIGAAAMIVFREVVVARFTAAGCPLGAPGPGEIADAGCTGADGTDVWWPLMHWWELLHLAGIATPIVLGAFLGAPLFPREFERGTHVFALTQSVGRLRWFAVKVVVVGVPFVIGLLVLGQFMSWMDASVWRTSNNAMSSMNFPVHSMMPAAFGLLSLGIAIAAGILTRRTVAALVTGLIVTVGGVAVFMGVVQPHVLTSVRTITSLEASWLGTDDADSNPYEVDPNVLWVGRGVLDASGNEINVDMQPCYKAAGEADQRANGAVYDASGSPSDGDQFEPNIYGETYVHCAEQAGVASEYEDYLPGSMLWPLRLTMTGICAALAALFLALGAWRLRWAVSKR